MNRRNKIHILFLRILYTVPSIQFNKRKAGCVLSLSQPLR